MKAVLARRYTLVGAPGVPVIDIHCRACLLIYSSHEASEVRELFLLGGIQEPSTLQAIPEAYCMGIQQSHHPFDDIPLTIHTPVMLDYSLEH